MSVYRSPAPRNAGLRPLEPEEEMRLLLKGADSVLDARSLLLIACTAVGAAALGFALGLYDEIKVGEVVLGSLYPIILCVPTVIGWVIHSRRVARLRKEGYDVDAVRRQVQTTLAVPRLRIRTEEELIEEQGFASDAATRASSGRG